MMCRTFGRLVSTPNRCCGRCRRDNFGPDDGGPTPRSREVGVFPGAHAPCDEHWRQATLVARALNALHLTACALGCGAGMVFKKAAVEAMQHDPRATFVGG
jgi:hypothetical protein